MSLPSWLTVDHDRGTLVFDAVLASQDQRLRQADTRTLGVFLRLALLEAMAPALPSEDRHTLALRDVPEDRRQNAVESAEGLLEAQDAVLETARGDAS